VQVVFDLIFVTRSTIGPSLRAAIVEPEREIRDLVAKVAGGKKGSVKKQIDDLRKFVRESVCDIIELVAGKHPQPARVRQELARHIDAMTLSPDAQGDSLRYMGQWELLGENTECAEGQS
jgi:hypothetical protein